MRFQFIDLSKFLITLSLICFGFVSPAGTAVSMDSHAGSKLRSSTVNPTERSLPGKSVDIGEKLRYDGSGTLSAGGDDNNFTIRKGGEVIITSYKSVRLLPGTNVQSGGNLLVKVKSTNLSHQKKKAPLPASVNKTAISSDTSGKFENGCKIYPLPEPETLLIGMNDLIGVLPVRPKSSEHSIYLIYSKNLFPLQPDKSLLSEFVQEKYLPGSRWGEPAETISVMRT